MLILKNESLSIGFFLLDDVAIDAARPAREIRSSPFDFFSDPQRHDGQRDELGVPVLERRTRFGTVVPEDHDVPNSLILLELANSGLINTQNVFYGLQRKRCQRRPMVWSLDDDLVHTHPIEPFKKYRDSGTGLAMAAPCCYCV